MLGVVRIRPTAEIPADLRAATQVTSVAHAGITIDGRSFAAGAHTLGRYEREDGEQFGAVPDSGLMYDC